MERETVGCDARLVRAARSLYVNHRNREVVDARIARASEQLITYLGLNGITAATLGVFDISLIEGNVRVDKRDTSDVTQLELPRFGELAARKGRSLVAEPTALSRAVYGEPVDGPPDLFVGDDVEMLVLLRRFVSDVSRHYEVRTRQAAESTVTISSPREAYQFLAPEMAHLPQEQLRVLNLNVKNRVLSAPMIYQGTIASTNVRMAEVFRPAVMENAFGIIVAHNHPSGVPDPSPEDVKLTWQLIEVGKLLDIEVLDHVIVGSSGFASLREQGLAFF